MLSLLYLLLVGCGGPPAEVPGGDAAIVLGTGTISFEPLEDLQSLPLISGPQGGHHFILHARMWGLDPGDPTMPAAEGNPSTRFGVFTADGERVDLGLPPYLLGYREQDDGSYLLPSGRIVQVEEPAVATLIGSRVTVAVQVIDSRNVTALDQVEIMVVSDDGITDVGADAGPEPGAGR